MNKPISIVDAERMYDSFMYRREHFTDESDHTSFMTVLLNAGDHRTIVFCVGGEWEGVKGDLTQRDGIPLCPNSHPLMESGSRQRLGWVEEEL